MYHAETNRILRRPHHQYQPKCSIITSDGETLSSEMYALNTYRGDRCHVGRVAANARRLFVLVKLEADFRSRV